MREQILVFTYFVGISLQVNVTHMGYVKKDNTANVRNLNCPPQEVCNTWKLDIMHWNWKSPARPWKWEGVKMMDVGSCQNFQALYSETSLKYSVFFFGLQKAEKRCYISPPLNLYAFNYTQHLYSSSSMMTIQMKRKAIFSWKLCEEKTNPI